MNSLNFLKFALSTYLAVIANTCLAESRYLLYDLGGPPEGRATATNDSSEVVGHTSFSPRRAFHWKNGVSSFIEGLSLASDIGNSGLVVGATLRLNPQTGNQNYSAAFWNGSTVIDFGPELEVALASIAPGLPIDFGYSQALDINNNNDIVGSIYFKVQGTQYSRGFLRSADGLVQILSPLSASTFASSAEGINDVRQIGIQDGDQATIYQGGVTQILGSFLGLQTRISAINNRGVIVGTGSDASSGVLPIAYAASNSGFTDLHSLCSQVPGISRNQSMPSAINEQGTIVGKCGNEIVRWHNGTAESLKNLIAACYRNGQKVACNEWRFDSSSYSAVEGINIKGQIVGTLMKTDTEISPVMLIPFDIAVPDLISVSDITGMPPLITDEPPVVNIPPESPLPDFSNLSKTVRKLSAVSRKSSSAQQKRAIQRLKLSAKNYLQELIAAEIHSGNSIRLKLPQFTALNLNKLAKALGANKWQKAKRLLKTVSKQSA